MKVSFFETAHYRAPRRLPAEWPVPPDAYDHLGKLGTLLAEGCRRAIDAHAIPAHAVDLDEILSDDDAVVVIEWAERMGKAGSY